MATGGPGQLLMTPRDAAKALAISERTLWTLTREGRIPSLKLGRLVRYNVEALHAWLRSEAKPSESKATGAS